MNARTVPSTEAQNNFGRILNDVVQNRTRYIISRRNTPEAIILSLSDFAQLLLDSQEQVAVTQMIREVSPVYELGKPITMEERND